MAASSHHQTLVRYMNRRFRQGWLPDLKEAARTSMWHTQCMVQDLQEAGVFPEELDSRFGLFTSVSHRTDGRKHVAFLEPEHPTPWLDSRDEMGEMMEEKYPNSVHPMTVHTNFQGLKLDDVTDLGRARAFLATTLARMRFVKQNYKSSVYAWMLARDKYYLQHAMAHYTLFTILQEEEKDELSDDEQEDLRCDRRIIEQLEHLDIRLITLFKADRRVREFDFYFTMLQDEVTVVRSMFPQLERVYFPTIGGGA